MPVKRMECKPEEYTAQVRLALGRVMDELPPEVYAAIVHVDAGEHIHSYSVGNSALLSKLSRCVSWRRGFSLGAVALAFSLGLLIGVGL